MNPFAAAPRKPLSQLLTPAVKYILGLTTLGLFVQHVLFRSYFQFDGGAAGLDLFGLSSAALRQGHLWQFVSYTFLHENVIHFALNMLVVFFLGRDLEVRFGRNLFVALYYLSGALAGLGWLIFSSGGTYSGVCIGASGAAFGLIGALAAAFPKREITLLVFFILPVTMTARMMAIVAAGVSLLLMFVSKSDVAHSAHLSGCAAGYLLALAYVRCAPARPSPRVSERKRARFRIVPYQDEGSDVEFWQREPEPEAYTDEEVNRILEKIKAKGLRSLSKQERDVLDLASRSV